MKIVYETLNGCINCAKTPRIYKKTKRIYDVVKQDYPNDFIIIMDYIEGIRLDAYIKNNTIDRKFVQSFVHQMKKSLKHIHKKNITHNDLKENNIMVVTENKEGKREYKFVILDWGNSCNTNSTLEKNYMCGYDKFIPGAYHTKVLESRLINELLTRAQYKNISYERKRDFIKKLLDDTNLNKNIKILKIFDYLNVYMIAIKLINKKDYPLIHIYEEKCKKLYRILFDKYIKLYPVISKEEEED